MEVLSKDKSFDVNKCRLVYVGVESLTCNDSTRQRAGISWFDSKPDLYNGYWQSRFSERFDYGIKALSILIKSTLISNW